MFKYLELKPRLPFAVSGSLLIYLLTPQRLLLSTRIIIAWNVGVVCFLSLVLIMIIRATPAKMRSQSQRQDVSRWIILIVTVIAACTSLLAIVFMLSGSKNLPQRILILHIALALLTIFTSWLLIHIMFALHYAHLYYYGDPQGYARREASPLGGHNPSQTAATSATSPLEFPGSKSPDYLDFVYFSLGIGMTSQVADVQITSDLLRRLALIHQVLSFFFNTLILALAINIMASLI